MKCVQHKFMNAGVETTLKILTADEVAQIIRRSKSWVYAHAAELGASRIGSSWIFTQEGLTDALQGSRSLAQRHQNQWKADAKPFVSDQKGSPRVRKLAPETVSEGLHRHGLV